MKTLAKTKAALIREPGYPVGVPAPMYLNCECGQKVTLPQAIFEPFNCPACGIEYDARGWILMRPGDRLREGLARVGCPVNGDRQ